MNACLHKQTDYRAEFVLFVMFRDYLLCRDCGAEYSLVYRKWDRATPSPESQPR